MNRTDDARTGGAGGPVVLSTDRTKFREWVRFTVVGASGVAINQVLLIAVIELLAVFYVVSAAIAT